MGNEEMVPFAYKVYQDYVMGKYQAKLFIQKFKNTFCRDEHGSTGQHSANEIGIKVHFLGLFDTVSSVGTLDVPFTKEPQMPTAGGTAEHVRHAVAIDERRVKFKAALFDQELKHNAHPREDINAQPCDDINAHFREDIKEVWFAGNHGDIGGGWPAVSPEVARAPKSFWKKLKYWIKGTNSVDIDENEAEDSFQHSDIALKWMIDELDTLGKNGHDKIQWDEDSITLFNEGYKTKEDDAIRAQMHDTMRIGGGCSLVNVIFWNIMGTFSYLKIMGLFSYHTRRD